MKILTTKLYTHRIEIERRKNENDSNSNEFGFFLGSVFIWSLFGADGAMCVYASQVIIFD